MALFLCCMALSCQLQQGTDGAHGPDEAVGAVGATFHVATCAHWHGVGARATRATWKARPGNMTSGGPRMDMSNVGATHDHLGTPSSPRRLPLGVSLPSLPCSRDSHALSRFQPALRPGLPAVQQTSVVFPELCPCLCLSRCASPACSPCLALLVLGCQELFFALPACSCSACLASSLSLSPAHCVMLSRHENSLFSHKFSFCLPFLW